MHVWAGVYRHRHRSRRHRSRRHRSRRHRSLRHRSHAIAAMQSQPWITTIKSQPHNRSHTVAAIHRHIRNRHRNHRTVSLPRAATALTLRPTADIRLRSVELVADGLGICARMLEPLFDRFDPPLDTQPHQVLSHLYGVCGGTVPRGYGAGRQPRG